MRLTNKHGLPEPILRAVQAHTHRGGGDYSVTQLIAPPRVVQLRRRHSDEIEEDASERLWALLGSSVHQVLEAADVPNALQEEWLKADFDGIVVTGTPDLYPSNGVITDYKVTSVWATVNGVKVEWEAQLNCYAYLYRSYGFEVKGLQIAAILRDWSAGRAKQGGDYPPIPFKLIEVPDWGTAEQNCFMCNLITEQERATELSDESLPLCKPEERWARPTTYAVMKGRNKRASKVCPSWDEAERWLIEKAKTTDGLRIEERPGANVRCEGYCNVSRWCNWRQEHKED